MEVRGWRQKRMILTADGRRWTQTKVLAASRERIFSHPDEIKATEISLGRQTPQIYPVK